MGENEVSVRAKILRELIADVTNNNLIGIKFRNGELRKKLVEPPYKYADEFDVELIDMKDFTMEFLKRKDSTSDKVILQLHGGGYVGAMRNAYRTFSGLYSEVGKGISVLTVDYRVAPEHPYPAALEDAITAYKYLLMSGYSDDQIIVAGDSAGGGLAMVLAMYLRDHNEGKPLGLVCMSPWTDLTASGPSYDDNYEIDPLFGNTRESLIYDSSYIGDSDPKDPYISPLFGDFDNLPPMLIQVGSYEMLLSDSVSAAAKAKDAGVKVRLSVYEGMFHVFQMGMHILPESKKAWAEVGKFIEIMGGSCRL